MKKALCFVLICAALLCPLCALGEAAPAEALDFGDFTMTMSPDTPGSLGEKANNSVLFLVYPLYLVNGDENSNLNVVWTDGSLSQEELTSQKYLDTMVQELTAALPEQYEQMGIKVVDIQILESGFTQVDGLNGMYYVYYSTLDYSDFSDDTKGLVLGVYTRGTLVSGVFGIYTFTGTARELESLNLFYEPLLETVRWK